MFNLLNNLLLKIIIIKLFLILFELIIYDFIQLIFLYFQFQIIFKDFQDNSEFHNDLNIYLFE